MYLCVLLFLLPVIFHKERELKPEVEHSFLEIPEVRWNSNEGNGIPGKGNNMVSNSYCKMYLW